MKAGLINALWERRAGQGRRGGTRESLPQSLLCDNCRHYQLLPVFPAPVKRVENRISPGLLDL